MTDNGRSKSPQSANLNPNDQGFKIVDLNTLRALQKAAKQVNPRVPQTKESTISVTDNNPSSPPQRKATNLQDSNSVSVGRASTTDLGTKRAKTPEEDYAFTLRSKFQQALSKLYAAETKDLAMSELKNIIAKNATPATLRIFISSLCEYKKVATIPTQECEVFLFGYLAEVFRDDLIDTRDKPPSIAKTCLRLIEAIQGYFNVTANSVQQACATSVAKLYNFSLLKQPVETKALLLYEPLGIIVTGGTDRVSQATAGVALMELINAAVEHNDKEFLEEIRRRYITAFLKINYELPELTKCLGLILYHTEIRLNGSKMHQILTRLKELLQTTSNVYMVKVEAAQTLRVLGIKLRTVAESFIGNLHEEIIAAISAATKDRIIKVQNAANAALKEWIELKKVIEDVDSKKKRQEFEYMTPEELIKSRTGLGVNEALKENYSALADSLENFAVKVMSEKPDINVKWDQISPGGRNNRFESNKKHTNFQKKNSGTGGGFVMLNKDRSPEARAQETHQKQRQAIKDIVLKNMEGRPMSFTDYDSKFQFFYPDQRNVPKNAEPQFPVIENSSIGSMLQDSLMPNPIRRPEHVDYKNGQQNLGDQLRPQHDATFNPKLKNIHNHIEQQILNEAYSTLKSGTDDINPLTHLADSHFPSDNSARFLQGSNVQDQNDDARAKRQTKGFIIRTQPQPRNLPPSQETKSYLSPQNNMNMEQGNYSKQQTALGDTTMDYPDLEDTMGYDDADVMRAASQFGNTVPSDLIQSNQRAAYEKEDPRVKPEQFDSVSDAWEKVLESLAEGDLQGAYDRCLATGDDLYLIRLMVKTGPCLEKLNRKTGLHLTNKTIKILNSQFLAKTCMGFFQEFFELNLVDNLALEDQNNMLKMFYELSAEESNVGMQSAELYSLLLSFINK